MEKFTDTFGLCLEQALLICHSSATKQQSNADQTGEKKTIRTALMFACGCGCLNLTWRLRLVLQRNSSFPLNLDVDHHGKTVDDATVGFNVIGAVDVIAAVDDGVIDGTVCFLRRTLPRGMNRHISLTTMHPQR